jgi:hypothetical protein
VDKSESISVGPGLEMAAAMADVWRGTTLKHFRILNTTGETLHPKLKTLNPKL